MWEDSKLFIAYKIAMNTIHDMTKSQGPLMLLPSMHPPLAYMTKPMEASKKLQSTHRFQDPDTLSKDSSFFSLFFIVSGVSLWEHFVPRTYTEL
ncbi:hypothetical protein ATCV1_z787L [Acanthocystis turfacea chlorella virus 1]|uniref:Uncharacterized protein z787L n=1 Tax=Chlorovirus heliozoae TaxID=322019 RepID=A7KA47_9PHYC|nr:hypothetical protein ATCV1_z787L [Acanthocystis turfacea chlorella virus 1]ABT16921.1 hypothetical protein ATCV1_z787L [Acanthocystis turfacea chlorella virus 1]